MDTRTGELLTELEMKDRMKSFDRILENFVPVKLDEMTPRQKVRSKVSKYDNRSKLGKKFTAARNQRRYFFK